ncbi:uncharacterized protein [Gossypium hirsutum]|uniref:Uncharacterized protein n=1 Tax=Gossypium hirsutum TaxID=3635 RepID=A0ABM3BBV4_GOSHI|nr:uncharacterized protein LOC121224951 [Gossypium hirsutum]
MTETYKDWHKKLSFALLAYRTSIRTSTAATPFSLVYRIEVVLPIEVEIPSLRVLAELKLDEAEWVQSRYNQLNLIKGKRLRVIQHGHMYQNRMMRAYNKRVRPREFREGDLGVIDIGVVPGTRSIENSTSLTDSNPADIILHNPSKLSDSIRSISPF